MSEQISLYNKFRPSTFAEVCGQESTLKIIQEQIRTNTLPHSLVFYGPPGCGKTTCARIVAKEYNAHRSGMREIDAANNDGKVESIRSLLPVLNHQLLEGDHLTVIFDEAHKLTEGAFQALQKVVEEPPSGVRFIFATTKVDKIPNTILDRSQRHQFVKLTSKEIFARVKEICALEYGESIKDDLLRYVVHVSDGSMRRALVALSQLHSLLQTNVKDVDIAESLGILGSAKLSDFLYRYLSHSNGQGIKDLVEASQIFASQYLDASKCLYYLEQYVVDVWSYFLDPNCLEYLHYDVKPLVSRLEEACSGAGTLEKFKPSIIFKLDEAYKAIAETSDLLSKSLNPTAVMRRFVIKLSSI